MSEPSYVWRKLTREQQLELLAWRQDNKRPWHNPPHRPNFGHLHFHVSAACYEHTAYIGLIPSRIDDFTIALLATLSQHCQRTVAWCVLPNHYHALVATENVLRLLHELGRLHGRTSHAWNGEENTRGRQVFHGATERGLRSERHFWATVNYIHHNPVHHGYVRQWADWRWSSAQDYLEAIGRPEAERIWREYPLWKYGAKWDAPAL